jgi:hypothetical protein
MTLRTFRGGDGRHDLASVFRTLRNGGARNQRLKRSWLRLWSAFPLNPLTPLNPLFPVLAFVLRSITPSPAPGIFASDHPGIPMASSLLR